MLKQGVETQSERWLKIAKIFTTILSIIIQLWMLWS